MHARARRRRWVDRLVVATAAACALLACMVLVWIVTELVARGAPALRWHLLTKATAEAGASGGVLYQLIGTLILVATALLVCLPPAVAMALLASVYFRPGIWRHALRRLLFTLNGIPSVLFGVFGLLFFVRFLDWGKSWLAGGIVLGMMVLPTVAIALIERIDRIPARDLETAASLGLRRPQIIASVILPQSVAGLISGALLGVARAAGETAPILFAAAVFAGATVPNGIQDSPVLALPYHIFVLAQDTYDPQAEAYLWASATVLLGVVLVLGLLALPLRLRAHEEARRA